MNTKFQNQMPYYQQYGVNPQPMYRQMPQMEQPIQPYIMQQPISFLRGRPVGSIDEARASQIDLDGSLFVFPDVGNKKIYTKQIMQDGTVSLITYSKEEDGSVTEPEYVTKEEFQEALQKIKMALQGQVFQQQQQQQEQQPAPAQPQQKPIINF